MFLVHHSPFLMSHLFIIPWLFLIGHLPLAFAISSALETSSMIPYRINSPPILLEKATIIVDISEQKLYLYQGDEKTGVLINSYPVSTSKYGIGNQANSGKTPLGWHRIEQKIGHDAPEGLIFKGRQSTGEIAEMNAPGVGDLITSRIMWLKGLQPGQNAGKRIDSYRRYIYIHGTAEENKIGQPASHGCVRMYNKDVIDLFDRVKENTRVYIKQ
jgi:lipoprotein-anchoring transpeptidase ErfK/SrfK